MTRWLALQLLGFRCSDMGLTPGWLCLQGVWLGSTPSGSPALLPPSQRVNVEPGCVMTDACASGPCPAHADCRDLWQTFSCKCWPGGALGGAVIWVEPGAQDEN